MAKKNITNIKFLCNASPKFRFDEEVYQAKPGFNEMPEKFTMDPYFEMCANDNIVQEFTSAPTDKQQEDFDAQIQAERERADTLQAELDALKAANAGQQAPDTDEKKKDPKNKE